MARVLVCDDDPNIISLVRILLELNGFEVRAYSNGLEALGLLGITSTGAEKEPMYLPDIILLDFEMPRISGFEMLRKLRAADVSRAIPVIMMSATKKQVQDLLRFEATFFLSKPFENSQLLAAIKQALPESAQPAAPVKKKTAELEFDPPRPGGRRTVGPAPREPAASNFQLPAAGNARAEETPAAEPAEEPEAVELPPARPPVVPEDAAAPNGDGPIDVASALAEAYLKTRAARHEAPAPPAPEPPPPPPSAPPKARETKPQPMKPPPSRSLSLKPKHEAPKPEPAAPPPPPPSPPPPPHAPHAHAEKLKDAGVPAPSREAKVAAEINTKHLVMRLGDLAKILDGKEGDWPTTESEKKKLVHMAKELSPLVKIVDEIISDGIERGASDIHLEPQEDGLHVRMRVDGQLVPLLQLPDALSQKIAARLKIMAVLDISERRIPQDGRFSFESPRGIKVECRVSTLPSILGEKIVLRLLRQGDSGIDWDSLGLKSRDRRAIEAVLKTPQGIVLSTGPTGSGKTTTLYMMLKTLNTDNRNIVTVEDPVEYRIPGITQVAVNPEIGLSFEKVLRSFLRQDPNIILVGEMRDLETAEIGLRAAVTGHLVLSTLHTNSAPATVARLINMGIKPFMIAAAVRVIVAQRLVRLLCEHCKVAGELLPEEAVLMDSYERQKLDEVYLPSPDGCSACASGYHGRRPIFEVMPLDTPAMKKAVLEGDEEKILAQAKNEGMTTLRKGALELVVKGLTSPQEALKVFFSH